MTAHHPQPCPESLDYGQALQLFCTLPAGHIGRHRTPDPGSENPIEWGGASIIAEAARIGSLICSVRCRVVEINTGAIQPYGLDQNLNREEPAFLSPAPFAIAPSLDARTAHYLRSTLCNVADTGEVVEVYGWVEAQAGTDALVFYAVRVLDANGLPR